MDNRRQYQCAQCGATGHSIRCSICGGDAEPIEDDPMPGGHDVFSHAQLGHTLDTNRRHRQEYTEREKRILARRFKEDPELPTHFGDFE